LGDNFYIYNACPWAAVGFGLSYVFPSLPWEDCAWAASPEWDGDSPCGSSAGAGGSAWPLCSSCGAVAWPGFVLGFVLVAVSGFVSVTAGSVVTAGAVAMAGPVASAGAGGASDLSSLGGTDSGLSSSVFAAITFVTCGVLCFSKATDGATACEAASMARRAASAQTSATHIPVLFRFAAKFFKPPLPSLPR
jgi:hypothetical protein